MRRRAIQTTKILSVAFALLPACTKTDPTVTVTSDTATAPPSAAPSAAASAPDPALINLAGELGNTERDKALANVEHFRPLCDAKGYPLVGNLPSKGMDQKPALHVDEVCAELRKKH